MKRIIGLAAATALLAALAPSAGATIAATQENVRHVANVPGSTGGHVVAQGDRLYVGAYGLGLTAFDISDRANPVKIGEYKPGLAGQVSAGDPGARADAVPDAAVWDGRHIVTLNGTSRASSTQQTEFLDFTDPASPVLLHRFTGGADGEAHNGDIVDERKLWLPSGGGSNAGLRIYDLSPLLQDPPAAPTKLFAGNPHSLWQSSPYRAEFEKPLGSPFNHTHDIEIYTDKRILLGPWDWVDQDEDGVPDPTYGERDIALLAGATGYSIPGSGANDGAVYVIDITDPANPVVITKWQNPGGNPIRYLHEVQFIDGLENTIVVTDEDLHGGCNEGALYTASFSENLVDGTKLDEWTVGAGQAGAPACMGSHVLSSKGGYIFMGAYISGLQVIDARDPANLTRGGQYIAEGMNSWGALYNDGYVYVGDFGARGLDVFEFFPEAQSALLKVGNPSSRLATPGGGISEILGACDPDADTNDVDGMLVEIPESKRDGTHTIRASGAADAPYDLDVYFWSEDCIYMSGIHEGAPPADPTNPLNGDVQGLIPEEAAYAYVDLWAGPPTYVYTQIDPIDL